MSETATTPRTCRQSEYGQRCGLPCVEGSSFLCEYHISDKDRKRLEKKAEEEIRRAEIVKITPEDLAAFEKIKESGKPVERFAFTDLGNAERFQWRNEGKFVWTANTEWLAYQNGVWIQDVAKTVQRAMHTTVRLIELEVELYNDEEMQDACIGWAKRSESNGKINASLERASALLGLARDYEDFDTLTTVLNLKNGEVNLCNS
jgi:hypothetical protein